MEAKSLILDQINQKLKQQRENNYGLDADEKIFHKNIKNIKIRIQKAVLKETRKTLIEEKQKLINSFKHLCYINYLCEKNIQKGLNELYSKLDNVE